MSSKYKFSDKLATYFITSTVVGWADVFTRNEYKDILVDSFKHCQVNQGLQIQVYLPLVGLCYNDKPLAYDL